MTHGHLPSRKHTFQVLTLETVLLDFLRRGISLYYIFFFHNKVCPGFSVSVFVLNLSKKIILKKKHELHDEFTSVWYKCCFLKRKERFKTELWQSTVNMFDFFGRTEPPIQSRLSPQSQSKIWLKSILKLKETDSLNCVKVNDNNNWW